MITVDFHDTQEKDKIFGSRNDYDDDKLITVKALTKGYTDNWGDEDCRKMVTLFVTLSYIRSLLMISIQRPKLLSYAMTIINLLMLSTTIPKQLKKLKMTEL